MTNEMLILLIFLILAMSVWPSWPYSRGWGYRPSVGIVVVLIMVLVWFLADHRPIFRRTRQDIKSDVQDLGDDLRRTGRDAADTIRRAAGQ